MKTNFYNHMHAYLTHLLSDITYATENVDWPFIKKEQIDMHEWLTDEEEERSAPVRKLEEWTGIRKEQLPPAEMLSDEQVHALLEALKKMLDACNWSFVLQTEVPERVQYVTLRENFDQEAKVKRWHHGFFELCRAGTEHKRCALGEYCQCAFYAELFTGFTDADLSPEEERAAALETTIRYLKRKHGNDWTKFYPYHLDANDDKYSNPDDTAPHYGEDEGDDWWRR